MARRGNGEGTLRQRADGRWEARLTIATLDGRQVRRSYFGKTRPEVQDKLDVERQAVRQGFGAAGNQREMTGAYLVRWLEAAKPTMRPRTWQGYSLIVRVHLAPAIGAIPLVRLGPADVQRMVNDAVTGGRKPQTVRNVHAVLRRALNQAVRWGVLPRNVATMVDLPRSRRYEAPVLTSEGARAVLAAVEGDRIGPVVVVTLATGMRQGEALGLRWSDVDLEAGQLTIRQTLQRAGTRPLYSEPKTSRSRRTIVLPAAAVAALRAQRSRQLQERLMAGSRWQDSGLVFTSGIGTPMMPGDLTKRLQRLLADAGLPRLRYHDLRHGTASLLTAQGIHPRTIMEILGHSTIAVTMNTYAHFAPALQREAASSLDAVLGSA